MATYLFDARISEVVGRSCPGDTSKAMGPRGTAVRLDVFKTGDLEEKVSLFDLTVVKQRGGKKKRRVIGLPLNPKYEPWIPQLCKFFLERGKKHVFPFTRQMMWRHSKKVFKGLIYPIESYELIEDRGDIKVRKVRNFHYRNFRLHALRHIRTTELVEYYGFDGVDLCAFVGWALQTTMRGPQVLSRYLSVHWQRYFPKLLKTRLQH